ncbi:TPA: Protein pih1d3, variant 2 [Trebouxia sp. C0004]
MANTMSMADQYEALAKLLQPQDPQKSEGNQARFRRVQPVDQRPPDPVKQLLVAEPTGRGHPSGTPAGIWEDDEIPHQVTAGNSEDLRETPSFEFLYKQAVTSTDAFLGITDKDASSACCEDLDLRIDLPNANSLSGKSDSVLLLISCHEHLLDDHT